MNTNNEKKKDCPFKPASHNKIVADRQKVTILPEYEKKPNINLRHPDKEHRQDDGHTNINSHRSMHKSQTRKYREIWTD